MKLCVSVFFCLVALGSANAQMGRPSPRNSGPKEIGPWHAPGHKAFLTSFIKSAKAAEVKKAIAEGADVNAITEAYTRQGLIPNHLGWSALYVAIDFNTPDVVNLLLNHHASPTFKSPVTGVSVLWLAALSGNVPAVQALLDHGAPANQSFQGETLVAKMSAMRSVHDLRGHYAKIIELLEARGAKS